jgi:hypothetical protein
VREEEDLLSGCQLKRSRHVFLVGTPFFGQNKQHTDIRATKKNQNFDKMKIGSPHHHKFLIFLQRRSTTNWKIVARHGMYNQILHAVTIADCNNCFVIIAVVHNNDVFDHQQIVILYSLMIDNSIQCRSYDKKYRARSHPPTQGL